MLPFDLVHVGRRRWRLTTRHACLVNTGSGVLRCRTSPLHDQEIEVPGFRPTFSDVYARKTALYIRGAARLVFVRSSGVDEPMCSRFDPWSSRCRGPDWQIRGERGTP